MVWTCLKYWLNMGTRWRRFLWGKSIQPLDGSIGFKINLWPDFKRQVLAVSMSANLWSGMIHCFSPVTLTDSHRNPNQKKTIPAFLGSQLTTRFSTRFSQIFDVSSQQNISHSTVSDLLSLNPSPWKIPIPIPSRDGWWMAIPFLWFIILPNMLTG